MTTKEAITIIEQARQHVQADGKTHDSLREAVRTLGALVEAVLSKQTNNAVIALPDKNV